jgi:hypothetical protein
VRSNETLLEQAHFYARGALERRWTPQRYMLEVARQSPPQWSHVFMKPHYGAAFRVRQRAGTARVTLGPNGTKVAIVSCGTPALPADAVPPARAQLALAAAAEAFRSVQRGDVALRIVGVHSTGASGHEVAIGAYAPASEGPLEVELDAETRELLRWFAPPFLKGSRDGVPLGRLEALKRATSEAVLPEGATLVRAEIEESRTTRVWRLRFDVAGSASEGHVLLTLHARSGVLAGVTNVLVAKTDLGERIERERAEAVVARTLPALLGPNAVLTALVAGAIVRGPRRRAGWIGTATLPDGTVARIAYADDEVEAAVRGAAVRTRVAASMDP